MKWIEALKKWNAARGGRYTVPRKGTPEHAEVKELMGGNAKSSGYVKLMYAKKVLGRTVDDYDPADVEDLREKKSDKRFRPSKISNASRALRMKYGTEVERKAIQEEVATEKKQRTAKRVASAYKPSLVEQLKKGKLKKAAPIEEEQEAEEMEFVPKPSRAEAIAQEARAARAAKASKQSSIKEMFAAPTAPKPATQKVTVPKFVKTKETDAAANTLISGLYNDAWKRKARAYIDSPTAQNYKALLEAKALPRVSTSQEPTGKTKDNITRLLSLFPPSAEVKKQGEKMYRDERKPVKTVKSATPATDWSKFYARMVADARKEGDTTEAEQQRETLVTHLINDRKMKEPAAEEEADRLIKLEGGAKKPKKKSYSAADAAADMKALGVGKKKKAEEKKPVKETGQISMMMRIGNHVMVAEPQPATIKVKGNLGELQTDADAPASGYTGFENRPKETTRAQAARKFNPEELRVRPLSELFMTKPSKGLVEEQLQGKGCWWMRELDEF